MRLKDNIRCFDRHNSIAGSCDEVSEDGVQIWRAVEDIVNTRSRRAGKSGPHFGRFSAMAVNYTP
jgi:hypothetical protein